jgi:hypothetical protein
MDFNHRVLSTVIIDCRVLQTKTMKSTTLLLFAIGLLASCSTDKPNKTEPKIEEEIPEIQIETTEYNFPEFDLPENYYLDSISVFDSVSRASYNAFFVQSSLEEMKAFNSLMRFDIRGQISRVQEYVNAAELDSNFEVIFSFVLRPIEFFTDDKVISVTHIIDDYTEGGNHHNYSWHSFNFNLNSNKKVSFSEVFNLQTEEDSLKFIALAEERMLDGGCTGWGMPIKLDFSFGKRGIYINPQLSWACGMARSLFPWSEFAVPGATQVIDPKRE